LRRSLPLRRSASTEPPPPLAVSPARRGFASTAVPIAVALVSGYALCVAFPPQHQLYRLLRPSYAPAPPAADSKEGRAISEGVEREMQSLELVQKLRAEGKWTESRPYNRYNPDKRQHRCAPPRASFFALLNRTRTVCSLAHCGDQGG
jgi:hypothetical protein